MPLVTLQDAELAYGLTPLLDRANLTVQTGERIGLIGRNGSGKSTLLKTVAGLVLPTSGDVYTSHPATLLGVGAALNKALSGDRNITLGGLAMGLSRDAIARQAT